MIKSNKNILLIITGSIAAVKSLELIRILRDRGINVTCVLSKGGREFITPLSCASISGNKVYEELFSINDEAEMGHIRLSRENDLIVVAPATANILAKMAHGLADDLPSTLLLASDKKILVAPAMNVQMWNNKAVQRNVEILKKDGIKFIGPENGELACGEIGLGRMSEALQIASKVEGLLGDKNEISLSGLSALVTSGPTIEAIDPVRYITNRSSGKQGYAIAAVLADRGVDVTLVTGRTSLKDPKNVNVVHVESAKEMLEACDKSLPVDIAICAAAVSDWGVADIAVQKIKKSNQKDDFTFTFTKNPDILRYLAKDTKKRPELVIGFAAETEYIVENARVKLEQKNCDWIVANDVSDGKVFESNENTVHIITANGQENLQKMSKEKVAERLVDKIQEYFLTKNKKVVEKLNLLETV